MCVAIQSVSSPLKIDESNLVSVGPDVWRISFISILHTKKTKKKKKISDILPDPLYGNLSLLYHFESQGLNPIRPDGQLY